MGGFFSFLGASQWGPARHSHFVFSAWARGLGVFGRLRKHIFCKKSAVFCAEVRLGAIFIFGKIGVQKRLCLGTDPKKKNI